MNTAAKKKNSLASGVIALVVALVSTCLGNSAAIASSVSPNRFEAIASSIELNSSTTVPNHPVAGSKTRAEVFLCSAVKSTELRAEFPANSSRIYDSLGGVALECIVAPVKGGTLRRSVAGATGAADASLQPVRIIDGLTGVTSQGNKIAAGLRSGDVRMNILGDEMFSKAYALKGGVGDAPQAFALGNQIYLRRGSTNLLSEVVHEGTHVLDELHGLVKVPYQINPYAWEKRAFFFERQFQRASGGTVEFDTIDSMLNFIYRNY